MSPDEAEALKKLLCQVARKKGFSPLSPKQAQAEYDAAAPEELARDQIDRIVRRVVAGKPRRRFRLSQPSRAREDCAVTDEMLVLNRNAGTLDPETARKLEELRKNALEEDDDDSEEDQPRLED